MTPRAPVFLTRLSLQNFRGYGRFDLELPAGPCAVLLSGPNGLGKTSLFEAIEWGLTGSVKRLDVVTGGRIDPRDLARRATGIEGFDVELAFQDTAGQEERVTRTQVIPSRGAAPEPVGTAVATVADLLGGDESRWHVTGRNLAEYLHLTHLHAQVASLRLVTFNARERWVKVSPLAGADRFERVRSNLTNSKAALTKLKEKRQFGLDDALAQRQRWTDLLSRLAELHRTTLTVRDALGPSEVARRALELRTTLNVPSSGTDSVSSDADLLGAGEVLHALRGALELARSESDVGLRAVTGVRLVPRQWAELELQDRALASRVVAAERETASLRAELVHRQSATEGLRRDRDRAREERERATARHKRIAGLLQHRSDRQQLGVELAEAEVVLRRAGHELEAAELDLRLRREELASHEAALQRRDHLRHGLDAIAQALKALLDIEAFQKRRSVELERREALAAILRVAEVAVGRASTELATVDAAIVVAEREREEWVRRSSSLQQALLFIAEHLRDDDGGRCPVCRSRFPPNELRRLALESVGEPSPVLALVEDRLSTLRTQREALQGRQAQVLQERRKAKADVRAVEEVIEQIDARVQQLHEDHALTGLSVDEARRRLARARDEQQGDVERIEERLRSGATADDLRLRVADGDAAVDARRAEVALADERRSSRDVRAAEVAARVSQVEAEDPSLAVAEEVLKDAVRAAALVASTTKQALDLTTEKLSEGQTAVDAINQRLSRLEEDLADLGAQRDVAEAARLRLAEQWRRAGLPPEHVVEATVDEQMQLLTARRREIDAGLEETRRISDGLGRWREAADLRALEEEVRQERGGQDEQERSQTLEAAVQRAQASLAAAERARDAADGLSEALQKVTGEFGDRALRPFDELFRRYLRALVHDERFHRIEATYEPTARSAGLRFKVDLGGSDTEAENILSEGQLGEVSLAAMLAASTAFPWSRWRALLLDDPTQYNDLIHATALFDVLRNLVRLAQHQVFVSTHDSEQADFFRRKLDSVGIAWVDCRYVAHGVDGIVAEVRVSGTSG